MPRTAQSIVGGYCHHVIKRQSGSAIRIGSWMTRTVSLLGLDASHRPIGCPQNLEEK